MNSDIRQFDCQECEHYKDRICYCMIYNGNSIFPLMFEPVKRFGRYSNRSAKTRYM